MNPGWPRHNLLDSYVVGPNTVQHFQAGISKPPFNSRGRLGLKYLGCRLPGNWDTMILPIYNTAIYRGLKQRYEQGKEWKDTCLNPAIYNCDHPNLPVQYSRYNADEFLFRGQQIDLLYESLAKYGWSQSRESHKRWNQNDGLYVNVTRGGHFVRDSGGLHRLILAQILNIPVKIRINVIHELFDIKSMSSKKEYKLCDGTIVCQTK